MESQRIGIIISSVRPTRVGPTIAQWVKDSAPGGIRAEIIDLAELNLPFFLDLEMPDRGRYDQPTSQEWAKTVGSFDGFIIALAEYNGGYAAALKNALDTVGPEWRGKPIGLVSYGSHGGLGTVTATEPVFATLGVKRIVGPSLTFGRELSFDGRLVAPPTSRLGQLWSHVLLDSSRGAFASTR